MCVLNFVYSAVFGGSWHDLVNRLFLPKIFNYLNVLLNEKKWGIMKSTVWKLQSNKNRKKIYILHFVKLKGFLFGWYLLHT